MVLFDQSYNTGAIDIKINGSALGEKSSFKMVELTFSSKLSWASYIISIAKTASKKYGDLICSMKFLSLEITLCPLNLLYGHAWKTVVMSGLVPLVATWNC